MLIDFKRADNSTVSFVETIEQTPPSGRLPVVPYLLAIVEQGEWWLIAKDKSDPQTQASMDEPKGISKGHTIRFHDSWFDYARRIMTEPAYTWWSNPFTQVFNQHNRLDNCNPPNHEGDDEEPVAENLIMPGNFLALHEITSTHARIVCRDSMQAPVMNPSIDNWMEKPWEWMMSTMVNNRGEVHLVGSGHYVFTPVVKRLAERWASLQVLELLPPLPRYVTYQGKKEYITGYCLKGANVLGHGVEFDVPLRLVGQDRIAVHPCEDWLLKAKPVIPLPL